MSPWIWLLIGAWIGVFVGYFLACLMRAAKGEDWETWYAILRPGQMELDQTVEWRRSRSGMDMVQKMFPDLKGYRIVRVEARIVEE